jgi:hypothetical protein
VLLPQPNSSNPGFGTAFAGVACADGTNANTSTAAAIKMVLCTFIGSPPGRCRVHDHDPAPEPQRATVARANESLNDDDFGHANGRGTVI